MKRPPSSLIILILFVLWTSVGFAQSGSEPLEIQVVDSKSRKAIAFANVSIPGTTKGTAASENGIFFISPTAEVQRNGLLISSVGYHSKSFKLQDFAPVDGKITLTLEEQIIELSEIEINEQLPDPLEIINDAIRNVPKNYLQTPFNMEIYSKVTMAAPNRTPYTLETILLTYRKGYVPGGVNYSRITEKRESGINPAIAMQDTKNKKKYFRHYPGFDVALLDQVAGGNSYHYSVFNQATQQKMKLEYSGFLLYERDTVCVINYILPDYNSTSSNPGLKGTLYISINSQAVVKHTMAVGSGHYEIIYRRLNGLFFPYFMKSEFTMDTKSGPQNVRNEIIVREVNLENVTPVENVPKNWYADNVPYRREYWDKNYPAK
jgi:hypothetical protein